MWCIYSLIPTRIMNNGKISLNWIWYYLILLVLYDVSSKTELFSSGTNKGVRNIISVMSCSTFYLLVHSTWGSSAIHTQCVATFVLRSSRIRRKSAVFIVRYSQKTFCFQNFQLLITLEPLDRFKLGFQKNVSIKMSSSIK